MEDKNLKSCADCGARACDGKGGKYPPFCRTTGADPDRLEAALSAYEEGENRRIMTTAADIEYEFYCRYTRVEETIAFIKRMGYRKIGIATCVGLLRETRILAKILRDHGMEVFGIACKAGQVDKTDVGIREECCEIGRSMCNPIFQAMELNAQGTELNIIMGLCVGHDALFVKYAQAPTTTLVVKDRVLGHNPVQALYLSESYYKKKLSDV